MAKFSSPNFLDGGLNYLKNNATKLMLIKAYTVGDSYATVTGNMLAEATVASGDFTLSSSGLSRLVTCAAKSATASASSGASPNLHFAFTDGVSEVIYVTDETTDQVITAGNTVNFPALPYTNLQPT